MINGLKPLDRTLRWGMVGGGGSSQIGYIHRSAVQIVRAVVIAIQPVERIHPGVIEMSGVQTQPGDVVRDIVGQPLDLIREFNAAPGVRMDNRPHTVLLPGEGAKGDNVLHHALPVFVIEARSQRAAARWLRASMTKTGSA